MMIPSIRAPAGVSGGTLDLFGEQLATVKLDDRPQVWGCGPELASRTLHGSLSVLLAQQLAMGALEADRGGGLDVDPWTPGQRAG
jgi:hypothetical protein